MNDVLNALMDSLTVEEADSLILGIEVPGKPSRRIRKTVLEKTGVMPEKRNTHAISARLPRGPVPALLCTILLVCGGAVLLWSPTTLSPPVTDIGSQASDPANTETPSDPPLLSWDPYYMVSANSLEEFQEQFWDDILQKTGQDLSRTVNSTYLLFDAYSIEHLEYIQYQEAGDTVLYIYWHNKDCKSCLDSYCVQFYLDLIYEKEGVDQAGATRGYIQTNEANLYTDQFSSNGIAYVSYVYLINDRYYCRYTIRKETQNVDLIAEQLKAFCEEIADPISE